MDEHEPGERFWRSSDSVFGRVVTEVKTARAICCSGYFDPTALEVVSVISTPRVATTTAPASTRSWCYRALPGERDAVCSFFSSSSLPPAAFPCNGSSTASRVARPRWPMARWGRHSCRKKRLGLEARVPQLM